ncbi:MAG: hypothetical protein R2800_12010 [Flavipsychrobacter sp.]
MKQCKKKTTNIQYQYFYSYKNLPEVWDSFLPDAHYLKSKNLKVTEEADLPHISFLYVLIRNNECPVLVTAFQLLRFEDRHINQELVKPYQYFFWRFFVRVAKPKLLVAGHLFRHDVNTCYFTNELSDYNAFIYHSTAIENAVKKIKANAALIKDMPSKMAKYFQRYKPEYQIFKNDISMEMEIDIAWESLNDYEEALKHKYAQRFRKIRKQWKGIVLKELGIDEVIENKKELYKLYQMVCDHQQVRLGFISEDFIPNLKTYYKEKLRVWGIYSDDIMIGFFSAWDKEEEFDMFYIGFDYKKNNKYSLYFNILFFSIEKAIELKKKKLTLGRTALDAKARLGCSPKYLSTYLYISNPFLRRRIATVQNNTNEKEGAWEQRHPFKKQ